jgi:hypothetical protein
MRMSIDLQFSLAVDNIERGFVIMDGNKPEQAGASKLFSNTPAIARGVALNSIGTDSEDKLLKRAEAAAHLRIATQTLAMWEYRKKQGDDKYNIPCVKVGGRAMYRLSDLNAFLARRTV